MTMSDTDMQESSRGKRARTGSNATPPDFPIGGTIELPADLNVMDTPAGGMPIVQGLNQKRLLAFIDLATRLRWNDIPGPTVLVHVADIGLQTTEKLSSNARNIRSFLTRGFDNSGIVVDIPALAKNEKRDYKPPIPFLVSNISQSEANTLEERECWSTANVTFFAYKFKSPPTTFAMTLYGVSLDADNYGDMIVGNAVRRVIDQDQTARNFILDNHDAIPNGVDPITHIRSSIRAESFDITLKGGVDVIPVFNIYIDPPMKDCEIFAKWIKHLRSLTYPTGHGNAISRDNFHCNCCKSRAHPTSMCPYPKISGWMGKKYDYTRSPDGDADYEQQSGSSRGRGGRRNNRGGRRGGRRGNRPY
ncbi:hypothetical protein BDN72DRAFT_376460 [Pluteus cervinus]|uniref:Uncharacterized protein n=1 Tax=Pluteus cervinus TaxID=181527 RepID=A0ACD3AAP3_9AGAR|nr:hypothetical protein BDN72DRAFT_376460 [Pluteus cervinus]